MKAPREIKRAKLNIAASRELFSALSKIKSSEETKDFLLSLLSSSEIKDIGRRFYAAKLLFKGKTYQEVEDLLGMSPLTINKINFKTRGSKILRKLL